MEETKGFLVKAGCYALLKKRTGNEEQRLGSGKEGFHGTYHLSKQNSIMFLEKLY
jgi:hypothetical protein